MVALVLKAKIGMDRDWSHGSAIDPISNEDNQKLIAIPLGFKITWRAHHPSTNNGLVGPNLLALYWRELMNMNNGEDLIPWLREVHQGLTSDEFSLFLIQCWFMWRNRNIRIYENMVQDPIEVQMKAAEYYSQYREAVAQPLAEQTPNDG
ncbi:unnamed protein product [Ilex paraguariensis]|uniref:Uncharacterized protein n=1 Tax=Ilex paraguariensis TaxID=185542 RepID=A0ABC8SUZ2_9AQUA